MLIIRYSNQILHPDGMSIMSLFQCILSGLLLQNRAIDSSVDAEIFGSELLRQKHIFINNVEGIYSYFIF